VISSKNIRKFLQKRLLQSPQYALPNFTGKPEWPWNFSFAPAALAVSNCSYIHKKSNILTEQMRPVLF
jgi:hypothetical protein